MVRSKAQSWLTKSYDAETRAQVQALLDNEDPTELIESFYKDLEFGTGGLVLAGDRVLIVRGDNLCAVIPITLLAVVFFRIVRSYPDKTALAS